MTILPEKPGHIADEVVLTVSRRARQESWPDSDKYAGHLVQRVYRHVRGHVRKNRGWIDRAGGEHAALDDFSGDVLIRLMSEKDEICHAENAFGDYVYKRCLDYADTLYAKKRNAGESLTEESEAEAVEHDAELGDLSATTPSVEELLIQAEIEQEREQKMQRIRDLVQQEGFLTDKEKMAFTFHKLGGVQIDSKSASKLTVCSLMGCSEKSARIYIKDAIAKIKEQLQ
jgi:DNA-directed RNA polymerase specialized sigma24 family protein